VFQAKVALLLAVLQAVKAQAQQLVLPFLLLLELARLVLLATERHHYDRFLQIHLHLQPLRSA
jgi:hypothetical protein